VFEPPSVHAHELRNGGRLSGDERNLWRQRIFQIDEAEAGERELTLARAQSLSGQFIFDVQTHFVRDDFEHKELLGLTQFAGGNWNPKLKDDGMSLARYKLSNYVKDVYYDSDTNITLLSGAPFDDPTWWCCPTSRSSRRVS